MDPDKADVGKCSSAYLLIFWKGKDIIDKDDAPEHWMTVRETKRTKEIVHNNGFTVDVLINEP